MQRRRKPRSVAPLPVVEPGGLGGEDGERGGKYGVALLRRAIKGGWNIPANTKAAVVKEMAKIAAKAKKPRDRVSAARVLVAADSSDIRCEGNAADAGRPIAPPVTVNTNVNVQSQQPSIDLTKLSNDQLASLEAIIRVAETADVTGSAARALPT